MGVEVDVERLYECYENATRAGVRDRTRFLRQSFFDTDLRDASVVTLYLLPGINIRLRPKLLSELKCGSRIVANHFDMGDWPPDMRAEVHHRNLLQWVVPAWVAGTWKCVVNHPPEAGGRERMVLRLRRHYQAVTGTARLGGRDVPVANGRLFADQFTFKLVDPRPGRPILRYACRVAGNFLRGTCQAHYDGLDGPAVAWGGVRA